MNVLDAVEELPAANLGSYPISSLDGTMGDAAG